tara:strand:+ start:23 stop:400 length:378 start_codon:yes stop_codon:yes gene_type:complete
MTENPNVLSECSEKEECFNRYVDMCARGVRKDPCYKCRYGTKRRLEASGSRSSEACIDVALSQWFSHSTWVPAQDILEVVKDGYSTIKSISDILKMNNSAVRDRLRAMRTAGVVERRENQWYCLL